ncbi:MAG: hypothetical protein Q9M39_08205 [Sulfurovum sp.]|nr:hypothetical protein [Sulfurovum sp.]
MSLLMVGCGGSSSNPSTATYTYTWGEMQDDIFAYGDQCHYPDMYVVPLEGHWEENDYLYGDSGNMFISGSTEGGIGISIVGIDTAVIKRTAEGDVDSIIRFTEETRSIVLNSMNNCIVDTEGMNHEYETETIYF